MTSRGVQPVAATAAWRSAVALLGVPLRRPPVFFPIAIYFPSTIECPQDEDLKSEIKPPRQPRPHDGLALSIEAKAGFALPIGGNPEIGDELAAPAQKF